jgi:hypothetical protein
VAKSASRFSRVVDLHRVLDLGGVSGKELFFWQLHLAVLLAGNLRRFAA